MSTPSLHEIAADFIAADDDIRELDEQIKDAKEHKKRIEDVLFTAMLDEGAPSVEVLSGNGKARIYPISRLYARRDPDVMIEDFCAKMHEAGYGELVKQTVNTNSLSAVVREMAEQAGVRDSGPTAIAGALPAVLAKAIKITTTPVLSIKRS